LHDWPQLTLCWHTLQTVLPLNYCRRIAAWLFEQLAHLQLQQDTPEASGAGFRTYHLS